MKTNTIFLFLIMIAFSLNVKAQLAGKKFELSIEQMGTFRLEFKETAYVLTNPMGEIGVTGTYKIEGNTIQFADKEGEMACPEEEVGKYKFSFQNKELKLELIEDSCTGRPSIAAHSWKLIDE